VNQVAFVAFVDVPGASTASHVGLVTQNTSPHLKQTLFFKPAILKPQFMENYHISKRKEKVNAIGLRIFKVSKNIL